MVYNYCIFQRGGEDVRVVFCDDEAEPRKAVRDLVYDYFIENNIENFEFAEYSSSEELLENESKVDMAFLDVEMSSISGTQAGAVLKERNPKAIVFIITGYEDYLDETMRYRLFRFYNKPVDRKRLFRGLKDAINQYNNENFTFTIEHKEGVELVDATEIVLVRSSGRKTMIRTTKKEYVSDKGINHWAQVLDHPFFYRSHRSCIISFRYVRSIERTSILLKAGKEYFEAYLTADKFTEIKRRYLLYRGDNLI